MVNRESTYFLEYSSWAEMPEGHRNPTIQIYFIV